MKPLCISVLSIFCLGSAVTAQSVEFPVISLVENCGAMTPGQAALVYRVADRTNGSDQYHIGRSAAYRAAAKRNGLEGLDQIRKSAIAADALYKVYSGTADIVAFESWLLRKASGLVQVPVGSAIFEAGVDAAELGAKTLIKRGQRELFEQVLDPAKKAAAFAQAADAKSRDDWVAAGSFALDESFRESDSFNSLNSEDRDRFLFSVGKLLKEQVDHNFEKINQNRSVIQENHARLKELTRTVVAIEEAVSRLESTSIRVEERLDKFEKAQSLLASKVEVNNQRIANNLSRIRSNRNDIDANKELISRNSSLIAANAAGIETIKHGAFGGLQTGEKLQWIKSGFLTIDDPEKKAEAISALELELVREKQLSVLNDVGKHAEAVAGAAALLQELGIGGELPEVLGNAANYALAATNIASSIVSGQWGGAIVGVAGLLGGDGPDVGAIRHQQVMDMLMGNRKLIQQVLKNQEFMIERIISIERTLHEHHLAIMDELRRIEWQVEANSKKLDEILNRSIVKAETFVHAIQGAETLADVQAIWELNGGGQFPDWLRDLDSLVREDSAMFIVGAREGGYDFDRRLYTPLRNQVSRLALADYGIDSSSFLAVSTMYGELVRKANQSFRPEGWQQDSPLPRSLESAPKVLRVSRLARHASPILILQIPQVREGVGHGHSESVNTMVQVLNDSNLNRLESVLGKVEDCIAQYSMLGGDIAALWISENLDSHAARLLITNSQEINFRTLPDNVARCYVQRMLKEHHSSAFSGSLSYSRAFAAVSKPHYLEEVLGISDSDTYTLVRDTEEEGGDQWKLKVEFSLEDDSDNNISYELVLPRPVDVIGGELVTTPEVTALIVERVKLLNLIARVKLATRFEEHSTIATQARLLAM